MKNLSKIILVTIFTSLLTISASFGQEEVNSTNAENKCKSGCCSSKEADTKMNKEHMDNNKMNNHSSIDKNKDSKIFECPMKCEAGKDSPGECSKCGMKLKEVSVKETEHKMMDHGKMDHSMMKHSKMEHKDHQNSEKVDFTEFDKNNDGKVFQCPMKCEVPQDNAGECSKCGMQLKEFSINHETK